MKKEVEKRIAFLRDKIDEPYMNSGIKQEYVERLEFLLKFYDAMFWGFR